MQDSSYSGRFDGPLVAGTYPPPCTPYRRVLGGTYLMLLSEGEGELGVIKCTC